MSPSDFLSIIQSLPKSQSGFPTKESISEATHLNMYNVKLMLAGLVENKKLRMEGNWYKFINDDNGLKESLGRLQGSLQEKQAKVFLNPVSKIWNDYTGKISVSEKQAKEYIEAITEENKHYSIEALSIPDIKMSDRFNNKDHTFNVLRWVMFSIGLCAGVMSCYYTQIWQHETLNIFWSWFLSLIMIGFSSAAFLTLIGILTKSIHGKFSTWLLGGIFFILWIICLLYSIGVTVAGRYSQYQEIVSVNQISDKAISINSLKAFNILDNINSLKLERDNNQKRLNILFLQSEDIQKGYEVKGETWVSIQSRILYVQNIISELNGKIENKNADYEKILESKAIIGSESKFGFYDWMAKIYKTDKGNIEWIMLLFPSLFLDIASPIALAVFMFLGRKKDE